MTDAKTVCRQLAELISQQYPDPPPPNEWRDGFYLTDTLTEDDFERIRQAITVDIEAGPNP